MQSAKIIAELDKALPRLAVIIPMFNEEMNAERCVLEVTRVLRERGLTSTRLFVVDDGSVDQTAAVLERLEQSGVDFSKVRHPKNRGYGAALVTGARAALEAGFDFGLYMDSDLTNDPELIVDFVSVLGSNKYDIVKASRYVKGGGMRGVPFHRQLITILGNQIASLLFGMGVRDCTNGFRAVRLSLYVDLEFQERGFPMIMEELFLLKKKGARAIEIPYILTSRTDDGGVSKFSYKPSVFWRYLKYALKSVFVQRG